MVIRRIKGNYCILVFFLFEFLFLFLFLNLPRSTLNEKGSFFLHLKSMIYNTDKMQGFRVELQVSGRGGEVTGKGQDFDKTGTRQ